MLLSVLGFETTATTHDLAVFYPNFYFHLKCSLYLFYLVDYNNITCKPNRYGDKIKVVFGNNPVVFSIQCEHFF